MPARQAGPYLSYACLRIRVPLPMSRDWARKTKKRASTSWTTIASREMVSSVHGASFALTTFTLYTIEQATVLVTQYPSINQFCVVEKRLSAVSDKKKV